MWRQQNIGRIGNLNGEKTEFENNVIGKEWYWGGIWGIVEENFQFKRVCRVLKIIDLRHIIFLHSNTASDYFSRIYTFQLFSHFFYFFLHSFARIISCIFIKVHFHHCLHFAFCCAFVQLVYFRVCAFSLFLAKYDNSAPNHYLWVWLWKTWMREKESKREVQ